MKTKLVYVLSGLVAKVQNLSNSTPISHLSKHITETPNNERIQELKLLMILYKTKSL